MSDSKPTAIYGRVSSDPDNDLESATRHNQMCLNTVAADLSLERIPITGSWRDPKDDTLGRWPDGCFVDNNISGSGKKVRPEYDKLMKLVVQDRVKVIVCHSQSRMWRNRRQMAEGMDLFADHGVKVIFIKSGTIDFSTASGRMQASVQGAMDAFYRETAAESITDAILQRAMEGVWAGSHRPFGFDVVSVPAPLAIGHKSVVATLIPREKEYRYLLPMYLRADPEGEFRWNLYQICKWLDSEGIRTAEGNGWVKAGTRSVEDVLTAARNIGYREHSAKWVGGRRPKTGKLYPGLWKDNAPIEDEELFWRVRNVYMDPKRRRPGRKTDAKHVLTGLVYCENGHPMYVQHIRNRPRWMCQDCWVTRSQAQVDAKAERMILKWMSENGPYDRAMGAELPGDIPALKSRIEALRKVRSNVNSVYFSAENHKEEILSKAEWQEQRAAADEAVKKAEAEYNAVAGLFADDGDDDGLRGAAFAAQWQKWTDQGEKGLPWRRKYARRLIKRVMVQRTGGKDPRPSGRLITIEPGPWADKLADRREVEPALVRDPFALTPRGKVVAAMSLRPGDWLSVKEVAAATGRSGANPVILRNLLTKMVTDGVAERHYCQFGTGVENGTETIDEMRERNGGDARGVGCHGYRLTDGAPVPVDRSEVVRAYRPPVRVKQPVRLCPVDAVPITDAGEFCSPRCRARAHYRRKTGKPVADPVARTCARCGKPLPAGKPAHALYCGTACRQAVSEDRRKING